MTDKNGPVLEVTDLSYRYGSLFALANVSFEVRAGEMIALVGRNGAGKSTLLRCISGWTETTEGDVRVMGQSIRQNERLVREHIVLLPDTPSFYDELTAWEHLQFVAQANGWRDWEEEGEDLLRRYGLLPNKDAFPFAFSRGMRYKLALLLEPSVLLMDEPLGPLDPVSADELWEEMERHRAEGMTIILSSHQLPQEAHPDRYIIMEQGEVIADGSPDALRRSLKLDGSLTLDDLLRAALRARRSKPGAQAANA
jgi:ABC-2 type transport system ATP-binding protein